MLIFSRFKNIIPIVFAMTLMVMANSCSTGINSSESLFAAIEKQYYGSWFTDVRFMLSVTKMKDGNVEKRSTYSGEYVYPAQSIIKTDIQNNNGYIHKNDSVFTFTNGLLTSQHPANNDFILTAMDIFNSTKKDIMSRLEELNEVNISEFCRYNRNDDNFYIVGIPEYSDKYADSSQIWFDSKTLFPVKYIKNKDGHIYQIDIENYIQIGGTGWIPQKITFTRDNEVKVVERIYDVVIPVYEKSELTLDNFCDSETINEKQLDSKYNFYINFMVEP